MKKKGIGKRILSALLAFSLTVSAMPAGSLIASADVAVDKSTTSGNVAIVQNYAADLVTANNNKTNYGTEKFSWDSTSNSNNWTYYNGMMLDAYTMLGSELNNDSYYDFVKKVYDNGNINSDGSIATYNDGVLGSVAMGLALFDIADDSEDKPTDEEIAALKAMPFTVDNVDEDDSSFMFYQPNKGNDFGLEVLTDSTDVKVVQVYDASKFESSDTRDKFSNGVVLTEFKGKLYCQWQSSKEGEDSSDTWVAYSVSDINNVSWSTPAAIATPAEFSSKFNLTGFCSSGGWYVNKNGTETTDDDILVAYINFWPTVNDAKPEGGGGYTYCKTFDGNTWSELTPVTMKGETTAMTAIFEQDPHVLDSGRIVNAAHFMNDTTNQKGLFVNPIYTDDQSGISGWTKAEFTGLSGKTDTQSQELEPSMYVNEDGNLVMVFRDQANSYHVLAALSTDDGETWSTAVETNLPDARQKQSAGNLPDGTAYIINCPVSSYNSTDADGTQRILRYPLVISLSADGKNFNDAYVIGSSATEDIGSVVHAGKYKRLGYHYPKSVVIGDSLYVAYARNKETVEYVKIPLSKISLKSNGTTAGADVNGGLITLTNKSTSTAWEVDNYLRKGDQMFVDKTDENKYFATYDQADPEIPEILEGSVYIRPANGDKSKTSSDELVEIEANKDVSLYIGIDWDLEQPDWLKNAGFEKVEGLSYRSTYGTNGTDGLVYYFYKKDIDADSNDNTVKLYGMGSTQTWNYIAMAVPTADSSSDKYQTAINNIYKYLTSSSYTKIGSYGGDFNELNDSDITLADVYMAQRFLIECANAVNSGELVLNDNSGATVSADTIYNQVYASLKWIGDNLYNSSTGLYSDSYNTSTGVASGTYDAKDVGFYAMTLVDTISMLPASQSAKKTNLTIILKQLFDGMISKQDELSGMWKTDITTSTNMSFEGSSMMAYALLKAYDEGILTDSIYDKAGLRAFNGVVESGMLNISTTDGETETTDESYASGVAPLIMASVYADGIEIDTTPYLSGTLSYSIYESETLTEEAIKKAAFVNVDQIDGTTTTVDLTATGVSCVWNKNYSDTPSEGSYVMTVLYNSEQLGQITVEVKSIETAWVDVETDTLKGTYKVVYSMDSSNTDGYLITRRGVNGGYKHSLCVSSGKDVPFDTVTPVTFYAYGEDKDEDGVVYHRYAVVNEKEVSNNNLWFIDENNHIYSVDNEGKTYYLDIDSTNKYIKYTNTSSTAPEWGFKQYSPTDTQIYNGSYYLNNAGTKNDAVNDIESNKGNFSYGDSSSARIIIWAPEYAEGKAALSGTTVYNVIVGDSSVNVSTIQKNAYVLLKKNLLKDYTIFGKINDNGSLFIDWTSPEKLAWSDSNITFSWNQALNTNVAGTYVMTVKYNDVAIGTITVNVGDVTWTDITDYTYERTTTLEAGKYYIITDSSEDDSINQNSATEIVSFATGVDSSNIKNSWADVKNVNITATTDGKYSITATDGATLGEASRWHYDASGHLYTNINGMSYYLLDVNASGDNVGKPVSVNKTYAWAVSWNAAASGDTDKTNLTTTGDTTRYLSYTSNGFFQSVASASTVTLYTPVDTTIKEVGMAGSDTYNVVANNNNLTETYIKAKTNFYLKTANTDGTSSMVRIPWTDLTYTWDTTLNVNVKGTYTMTVSYQNKVVGTVTVNVKEIQSVDYSGSWWIGVGLGQEPDFSGEKLTVTYTDGTTETVTLEDGVEFSNYNTAVAGEGKVTIEYMGYTFDNHLTLKVWDDPYAGLTDATDYPDYPEDGAVRINKTATNDDVSWYDTGVTKVELDVAGTSVRSGVDVILITDISNSMGREYTSGDKTGQVGQKLDEAMDAANDLAEILLADGNKNNNSISFVTFGGYDTQNAVPDVDGDGNLKTYDYRETVGGELKSAYMLDATQTVFVYEQNLSRAQTSFNGTKFITRKSDTNDNTGTKKYDIVQIADNEGNTVVGNNSGGTNYDYAFAEAINAVTELKAAYSKANNNQSYDASGRQIVLLFMTDGAPTYYNYEGVTIQGGSGNYLYGTQITYPGSRAEFYPYVSSDDPSAKYTYTVDGQSIEQEASKWWELRSTNWYNFTNNANEYAVELNSLVDAFYAVGFKMSEDLKISKHCYNWDVDMFKNILAGVAGVENGKQAVDGVIVAEDVEALGKAYVEMTEQVTNSGTYAKVYDEIDWDFTLLMDENIKLIPEDGNSTEVKTLDVEPVIEIKKYDINSNGERTGNDELLEKVRFEVDSNGQITGAYSDQVYTESNGVITPTNIFVDENTTDNYYQIKGKYFTYTYSNGWEYFDWTIQTIAGYEYALSYYAYLEGTNSYYEESTYNVRGTGVYDTNEKATLTYVDIDGNKATQTFPIPQKPWGEAITTIEYYLVDSKTGKPVNYSGVEVPFENRIRIELENESDRSQEIGWGEELEVSGNSYLPSGYDMYSPDAGYKVIVGTQSIGTLAIINDTVSIKDANGNALNEYTTVWTNKGTATDGEYDVSNTHVAFGVYLSDPLKVTSKFNADRIVLDYGKAIQVDVFENDSLQSSTDSTVTYEAEVKGFRKYDTNQDYINYVQSSPGIATYKATYGTFSIVEDENKKKIVQYQPTAMVSEVEKIFVVIKVMNPYASEKAEDGTVNSYDYFYIYQELDVIPATSVYYETDFVSSQINTESSQSDSGVATVAINDVFTTVSGTTEETTWTNKKDEKEVYGVGDATVITSQTENSNDDVQNPGPIGKDLTYGYDSSYSDDTLLSNGSSMFVEGQEAANGTAVKPTVTFSFTGTGFDVISRTGKAQGLVRANVYDSVSGKRVARMSVLNQSESTWGELYQIPVISIEDLDYGTYNVDIEVYPAYKNESNPSLDYGNDFYFDAVRIYDPIDVSKTDITEYSTLDTVVAEERTSEMIAKSAYAKDGEAFENVKEVRDILIEESESFDITKETPGVIFIEQFDTSDASTSKSHHYNLLDYEAIGPNNEVYLNESQAIAFKLTGLDTTCIASIDIGAKSVDGSEVVLQAVIASEQGITDDNAKSISKAITHTISSSTSMNYGLYNAADISNEEVTLISDNGEAYVFITNYMTDNTSESNESGAKVLSITDIKIAYSSEPGNTVVQYMTAPTLLSFADMASTLEPDYDVSEAKFSINQSKIFSKATMLVQTSQYVEEIKVTDMMGRSVDIDATYEDQPDGIRIWEVTMTMTKVGNHTYKVTGYGAIGTAGETAKAKIQVTLEGGGWQDAKNIFKTLFNCRILSIKRGSSNRLRWSER